jgi:membrane protease YdiL (CAAX protease family)
LRDAALWSLLFASIVFGVAALASLAVAFALTPSLDEAAVWLSTPQAVQLGVQGITALGGGLLATWIIGVRRFGMDSADLRWRTGTSTAAGVGPGLLFGLVPALGVLVVAAVIGDAGWRWAGLEPLAGVAAAGRTVLMLAPAALAEEVIFRGVPIVLLAAVMGRGSAVVAVAVVFGAAHLLNPNVTAMGVANVTLAGVLLGTVFYGPGGLWAAFGAHLGWNATLALSGAAVSGLPMGAAVFEFEGGGPDWLTGGMFGPEGGLAATAMLGIAVIVAARRIRSEDG